MNAIVLPRSELATLQKRYADASPQELVKAMITKEFAGQIALASSFGAESAVLLHLVAQVDRNTPVIMLDTGKLFGETKKNRDHRCVWGSVIPGRGNSNVPGVSRMIYGNWSWPILSVG